MIIKKTYDAEFDTLIERLQVLKDLDPVVDEVTSKLIKMYSELSSFEVERYNQQMSD